MNIKKSLLTLSALVFLVGSNQQAYAGKTDTFSNLRQFGRGTAKGAVFTCTIASVLHLLSTTGVSLPTLRNAGAITLASIIGASVLGVCHSTGLSYHHNETGTDGWYNFIRPISTKELSGFFFGSLAAGVSLFKSCY